MERDKAGAAILRERAIQAATPDELRDALRRADAELELAHMAADALRAQIADGTDNAERERFIAARIGYMIVETNAAGYRRGIEEERQRAAVHMTDMENRLLAQVRRVAELERELQTARGSK